MGEMVSRIMFCFCCFCREEIEAESGLRLHVFLLYTISRTGLEKSVTFFWEGIAAYSVSLCLETLLSGSDHLGIADGRNLPPSLFSLVSFGLISPRTANWLVFSVSFYRPG